MRMMRVLFLCGLCVMVARPSPAGSLRAGAARVDITPAADAALPMAGFASRAQGFKGIHDHVYVRAIVIDDGTTQGALVAWESLFVPNAVWEETSKRIASETGITAEHVLLSAVHDHGAPSLVIGAGDTGTARICHNRRERRRGGCPAGKGAAATGPRRDRHGQGIRER